MQQKRLARVAVTIVRRPQVAEQGQEVRQVVSVNGADIKEAHLLKQSAARQHAARVFLGAARRAFHRARKARRQGTAHNPRGLVRARRQKPRQIRAHRSDRRRDGHVVVVQNHNQARAEGAGVVHRLVCHSRAHRAVADDTDDALLTVVVFIINPLFTRALCRRPCHRPRFSRPRHRLCRPRPCPRHRRRRPQIARDREP